MKKIWFAIFLALAMNLGAFAQSAAHIRESGEYLWAEGTDLRPSVADGQALTRLVEKLAATDILPVEKAQRKAMWQTYTADLRACTQSTIAPSGSVMRYIAWRDIDKVFQPRWRKVRELIQSAEKATDPDKARTYAYWARTYLSSLPYGEPELRAKLAKLEAKLGPGRTDAVRMRNVETEVSSIAGALAIKPAAPKPLAKKPIAKPTPVQAPTPQRAPFGIKVSPVASCRSLSPLPMPWTPGTSELKTQPNPRQAGTYWRWSALLSTDLCQAPAIGLTLIGCGKRFGFYASAKTNFRSSASSYDCLSDGSTSFGTIWASGNARQSRLCLSAGPVVRLSSSIRLYSGIGYGQQTLLWEDTSGQWAKVSDRSLEGLLLDAGLLYDWRHLTFGLGLNEISFSSLALTLSAGWTF